ncbi:MAG: hypothetical protein ACRDSK_13825 [Actinophytocola sp.]|uniref:hypothetical protein n=1 Tax=Actinophytocola sp. TaxID=1872138 RepID=UPI003D6A2868
MPFGDRRRVGPAPPLDGGKITVDGHLGDGDQGGEAFDADVTALVCDGSHPTATQFESSSQSFTGCSIELFYD